MARNINKFVGLKDGNKIFIAGDELETMVSAKLQKKNSKKKISDALFKNGLVTSYKGHYSSSIPGSGTNWRYYCIDGRKLFQIVNPNTPDVFR